MHLLSVSFTDSALYSLVVRFSESINNVLDYPLLRIGNSLVSLGAIAQFMLVLLIALVISLSLKQVLSNYVLGSIGLKQGTREAIATVTSYSLGTLFCIALLQAIGINLASLAVLAGSLGIGIGFGLQEITRNFISGITLLIEQKLKVGDFIEWDGMSGYIVDISLRSTVVRTITQRHIVLPNSHLVGNQIVNWTYQNPYGWVSIPISVAHESDPVQVIEVLMDSAYLEESVSYEYPPEVYFTGITHNSYDFHLWVWMKQIDKKYITESSLRFIIEQNLRQHGLKLASPRLDVWQRNPNVVIKSSPESYDEHAVLQQPANVIIGQFTKPVPVRTLLKQLSYFESCSEIELRKLVEIGHRRHLQVGEILYEEGGPGDAFYIILSGSVGYAIGGQSSPTVLEAGQYIGEFSLMLNVPRTVTVKALEETTVFSISPQGFKKLLNDQPRIYDLIVKEMGKHRAELSMQQRRLQELGLINPAEYDINPVAWIRKNLEKLFSL